MKIINPQLSGSVYASGSFVLPSGRANQRPTNPPSGSLFFEISDSGSILTVYNGSGSNGWEIVGKQTTPYTPPPPPSADIEYLVVAGGGGGSDGIGGGGGAGGFLSSSLNSMESGSSITVTVGAGGTGGDDSYGTNGVNSSIASAAGTAFNTVTSNGGGHGGYSTTVGDGGSGGGGSGLDGTFTGGSGTVGQGFDGGTGAGSAGLSDNRGGGGGGASAAGTGGKNITGDGGDGKQSSITGTATYYAGGGGGSKHPSAGSYGAGGLGGGGNGDVAGTTNTGGGGGGSLTDGRAGGSGIAIFAYDSGSVNAAGGIVGDAGNGRKYNQFNASSTFKVGSTSDFEIHTSNLVMHVDAGNFASRNGNTSGVDLSPYNNSLNLGGQSGGSLTDNPWWNCDGTGGLADFERNGGSTSSTVAQTGYGSFTGRTTAGWCIDFWFRSSAANSTTTWGAPIIGRNDGDLYGQVSQHEGKLTWLHFDGSWLYAKSTTNINDGSWHHCVLNNYTDETIDVWVDGTKESNKAASAINPDTRYFKLDSLGRGYNGVNLAMDIGQLRIYDATLTDTQVLQNYNATKTNFV